MDLHFSDRRILLSIHAPTRGATFTREEAEAKLKLSIHAPTRGATAGLVRPKVIMLDFQSTLLQEERPSYRFGWNACLDLSIHAPTRGATITALLLRI